MLNLAVRNTSKLIRSKSKSDNIRLGRLFTKKNTARLMAEMIDIVPGKTAYTVLDAGAGTGILGAAAVEYICKNAKDCKQIFLTCYENNPMFLPMLEDNLERIRKKCRHDYDVRLFVTIYDENYLVDVKNHYTVTFVGSAEDKFDVIICNPPKDFAEKYSKEAEGAGGIGATKLPEAYLFAKVASEHLEPNGQLIIMLPSTYASASQITPFRLAMAKALSLQRVHLFLARQKNTSRAVPIKKEIILSYKNCEERNFVTISTSSDDGSAEKTVALPPCDYNFIVDSQDGSLTLPKNDEDIKIVNLINEKTEKLASLGLKICTGLVIDSKCKNLLSDSEGENTVPVIHLGAMRNGGISFPAKNTKNQYISGGAKAHIQKNKNILLIKRVPAKSDTRFLNSAVYFASQRPQNEYISTHNKLNYVDTVNERDEISPRLAFGLFAIFNSTIYDRYISIVSKSKQINAKELRKLPLPHKYIIESIGTKLIQLRSVSVAACDSVVNHALHIRAKE